MRHPILAAFLLPLAPLPALLAGPTLSAAVQPTISRLLLLPLFGRTTVVIELSDAIPHLDHSQPTPTSVVIEGGPVAPGLASRKLEPSGPSPLVSGVSLTVTKRPDGMTYFRMSIALTAEALHSIRTAGTRVYVDLTPPGDQPPSGPTNVTEEARQAQPPASRPPAEERPRPSPSDAPAKPAPPARDVDLEQAPAPAQAAARPAAAPKSKADADKAYRDLESETLSRARDLAGRPDVKGLLKLKEDAQKRDEQLGKQQPDLINRVMDELSRLTDQARALQLERDRGSFKE
jgi:hypothetical protein